MKTADFIVKYEACEEGGLWAMSVSEDMVDVWEALIKEERLDWLLWVATCQGIFSDKILTLLSCRFVRETPLHDGGTVWNLLTDSRSQNAVETAERVACGDTTVGQKNDAASASVAAFVAVFAAVNTTTNTAAIAAFYAAAYAARASAYEASVYAIIAAANPAADAATLLQEFRDFGMESAGQAADASAYASAARAAQVRMIAELGNPFKEVKDADR